MTTNAIFPIVFIRKKFDDIEKVFCKMFEKRTYSSEFFRIKLLLNFLCYTYLPISKFSIFLFLIFFVFYKGKIWLQQYEQVVVMIARSNNAFQTLRKYPLCSTILTNSNKVKLLQSRRY